MILAVAAAGALGAVCRFLLDSALRSQTGYPVGTLVVNVTGSLLLGLLAGLVSSGVLPDSWRDVAGAGFLGGYTTFSTAAVETVLLMRQRRAWPAVAASVGMLIAGVLAAWLGLVLGTVL